MEGFPVRFSLKLFFLPILCLCLVSSSWAQSDGSFPSQDDQFFIPEQMTPSEEMEYFPPEQKTAPEKEESLPSERKISSEKKELLTRGQKTLLLNAGSMTAILIYGLLKWEYGESSFNFKNEGWFERGTKYGGADKVGHLWTGYMLSHLYSYIYRKWRYTDKEANLYGSLSSLGAHTFMELADGFSPSEGFSYEDMIMNILGCGAGYIWGKYPNLAKKIDFRMEYTPEFNSNDFGIATNYERQRFLIALKADGFDTIKNRYLQYLEFHVGYYARGYRDYRESDSDNRRRYLYAGLGVNLSKLLQKYVNTRVLDYVQIPYTSLRKDFPLD